MLKFAVPSYFVLHGAVARFVVDGFGQSLGLLFWKFNANSCLSNKFTFIRDKKGRLILLYCLILQLPPIMNKAVAKLVVEDFGENCLKFGNLKTPLFGMQIHVY